MGDKVTASLEGRQGLRSRLPSTPRAVAHDLRQPLAAIRALVTLAERQPDVAQTMRRCLHQIRGQIEEMDKLCLRIVEDQQGPRTRVAVHELARSVAEAISLATGRAVTVSAADAFVEGDVVDLRRALRNLLENACRATRPGGQVCVRVTATDGEVRVEVHDDGPGFGLADGGRASLGLYIVDAVATEHGGYLEIAESDLGGAGVGVVLPRASRGAPGNGTVRSRSATDVVWSHKQGEGRCVS